MSESIRKSYEARFGAAQADALVAAAEQHKNDDNQGSDPFKWAVLIAIGYQCVELYGDRHGITVSYADFHEWCCENAKSLLEHDGAIDYLSLMVGKYNFIKEAAERTDNALQGIV